MRPLDHMTEADLVAACEQLIEEGREHFEAGMRICREIARLTAGTSMSQVAGTMEEQISPMRLARGLVWLKEELRGVKEWDRRMAKVRLLELVPVEGK